ncbi:PC3-like endoprotease variant B [Brachionus plicatilis]|uniref:PC3-like endoprotease variant B n=1 Tax=Brachionus plicatilis TaxID=10195 RepID=A0A3M7SL59_BRAPC|nr:PC3-like endoprotease variant B [Brachionus plicatilis]
MIKNEILKDSLDKNLESEIYAKRNRQKQFNNEIIFNDENYDKQWYLINDGKMNLSRVHDINLKEGWIKGFSGKNVSIVVIDDGLDHEHPDFKGKYRADLSYDLNDENDPNHDPMPATFDNQNNHGTKCAGVAAAIGNNSVCGVGVAFNAQIGAIRVLDGAITDLIEARALSYMSKFVDIKRGPRDDGAHMEYPGYFVNLALEDGIKNGRNGKGTLYVWASGNGGGNDDDCSCDGYASHWNIISIGSINHKGLTPYFMEFCPSTMAVVYSGGQNNINGDEDDPGVRVVASDVRGKCTTTFQGTSSAAPLAAGAFALVLEANPRLTYRDVMHLITKTARIPNLEDISGWIVNGGRFHVNEKYGFGVLDVALMIQEAQNWNYVAERMKCEVEYMGDFNLRVLLNLSQLKPGSKIAIKISAQSCITLDKLEHVVANISFEYSLRGNVKLTLISPHGTPSEILSFRKNDKSKKGIRNFPFMTLFNWGENPRGTWKLIIETKNDSSNSIGRLQHFSLILYGTKQTYKRFMQQRYKDFKHMAFFPDKITIQKIYERELIQSREIKISHKNLNQAVAFCWSYVSVSDLRYAFIKIPPSLLSKDVKFTIY